MPSGVPRSRSVVSSIIEEDPLMAASRFEYNISSHMDLEMVLPTGEHTRYLLPDWLNLEEVNDFLYNSAVFNFFTMR